MFKKRKKQTSSSTLGSLTELKRYLNQPLFDTNEEDSFDLLAWWKKQQSKYPLLSIMACDILIVSVSIASSEASFSTGGRVITEIRYDLSPKNVKALVCLKDCALADTRRHEVVREKELVNAMEKLKLLRPD